MSRGYRFSEAEGGSSEAISTDLASLAFAHPSNTTGASSTKRTFTKSTYCLGISNDNFYNPSYINLISRNGNSVTIRGVSYGGYGFGYVLPDLVKVNETITVKFTKSGGGVFVNNYQSDGTYLNSTILSASSEASGSYTRTFSLPSSAAYGVLIFQPNITGTDLTFTLSGMTIG